MSPRIRQQSRLQITTKFRARAQQQTSIGRSSHRVVPLRSSRSDKCTAEWRIFQAGVIRKATSLYKMPRVFFNSGSPAANRMPHLDFREALSPPEERIVRPVEEASVATPALQRTARKTDGHSARARLGHSGWANIVFVTIASAGGLACAFYFFNGADLLRAAAGWSREFLYPQPSVLTATATNVQPLSTNSSPATSVSQKNRADNTALTDTKASLPDLTQATSFATVTGADNAPGNLVPPTVPSTLTPLPPLPNDLTPPQNLPQPPVTLSTRKVARNVSKPTRSVHKIATSARRSTSQPNVTTTAKSASQTVSAAQSSTVIPDARSQSQLMMGGGLTGGLGAMGSGGGGGGGGGGNVGGVVGGLLGGLRR
jgi:hypothetical protein